MVSSSDSLILSFFCGGFMEKNYKEEEKDIKKEFREIVMKIALMKDKSDPKYTLCQKRYEEIKKRIKKLKLDEIKEERGR